MIKTATENIDMNGQDYIHVSVLRI